MSDSFWESYEEEERSVARGRADGARHGENVGYVEAWEMGVRKGYETGVEIGYYMGCVSIWKALHDSGALGKEGRLEKWILRLEEKLTEYPRQNVQDVDLQQKMDDIRSGFREIVSVLGLTREYFPEEQRSLEF
ncbi:hypothetical protein BSKO_06398 [Bryopsis sp. KO-2023]|nr:hypothetical protein BSKO_06398 [Bryopsis sp. KO-2023]